MNDQVENTTTWVDVLQRYIAIKILRPQSINNYTRYIEIFSRFFGNDFNDINSITTHKVTLFRSFF